MAASSCVHATPAELLPLFQADFSRTAVQDLLRTTAPAPTFYWRLYTPLVVLWGFILQRLQPDHTLDAVVSQLHSGVADALDPADPHAQPLSQRLRSESTAAFSSGRARLPLALLATALRRLVDAVHARLATTEVPLHWQGHPVRLLDGTTFRLRPTPDLVATYGQTRNQYGDGYWVVARSVATFCLYTQQCTAVTTAAPTASESALVRAVMEPEGRGTVFVGDSNFGVYRVVQVAQALGHDVVLRCQARYLRARLRAAGVTTPVRLGQEWLAPWVWHPDTQVEPGLPTAPIPGRWIAVQLRRAGFRPRELYLFTTLTDLVQYPLAEVVALYAQRWQVELDYRHLKTTLELEEFAVETAALFRKELAAGLLTYNLIGGCLAQAAVQAGLRPQQLSYVQGLRRIRALLVVGVPAWVVAAGQVTTWVLARLARCRLRVAHHKVEHEPRKVRRRPQVYPALKGDRAAARAKVLAELGWEGQAATLPIVLQLPHREPLYVKS